MSSGNLEVAGVVVLVAVFVALSAVWLVRRRREIFELPRSIVLGVGALFVAGALVRLFATTPALVHGSMHHAAFLVESVISFPSALVHRGDEYGYGSFVVLGLACGAFGRSVETLLTANALVSALTIVPIAVVSAHWSGRRTAALYGAAAWAASPLVARLAHSEDAHVVATAFALAGLAWLELAFAKASRLALALAAIATVLAVMSRQTLYPWVPLACAVLVERWWRARARGASNAATGEKLSTAAVAIALVVICLPLLRGLFALSGSSAPARPGFVLGLLGIMARHPRSLVQILGTHPFFDVATLSVLVPTLGLVGAISLCRRGSPIRLAYPASLLTLFVVTLAFAMPIPGDRWAFRLPLYALALVTVGVGAARLEEWLLRRVSERRAGVVAPGIAVMVALVGLGCKGTLDNRRESADLIEYKFLRDQLEGRPRPITLVGIGLAEALGGRPDVFAVRGGEDPRSAAKLASPWLFLDGRACHAYSYGALFWPDLPDRERNESVLRAWFKGLRFAHVGDRVDLVEPWHDVVVASIRLPNVPRNSRCEDAIERLSRTRGTGQASWSEGPVVEVEDAPPFFLYDRPNVTLRLFEAPVASPGEPGGVNTPSGRAPR